MVAKCLLDKIRDLIYRIRVRTLQGYVDAVLYRDVIERHEVPSVQALRYTLEYIKSNFAHKISTRAISGALKGLGLSDSRELEERMGEITNRS